MKLKVLTRKIATNTLITLTEKCRQFDVAVAWAGKNDVTDAFITHKEKANRVVIGTHMYHTDPDVLRKFMFVKTARWLYPKGRLFHPKIYLFREDGKISAVVGSHNLTEGAFGNKNVEASVLIEGDDDSSVFSELDRFLEDSWHTANAIEDNKFLYSYEVQYKANKNKHKDLETFHELAIPKRGERHASLLSLSWSDYLTDIEHDQYHDVNGRLDVLEYASLLFSKYRSLVNMDEPERRAIAGIYGKVESQLAGLSWGWFGSMFGHGDFKNLISTGSLGLSEALDCIPSRGDVSFENFQSFSRRFKAAFRDKTHVGGVPVATRLLAMKRPDMFVAINQANKMHLCNALGVAYTTLDLKNYWERIILPIRLSPWYQKECPEPQRERRIWNCRAAMLDCIYYDPSQKASVKKKARLNSS